MRSFRFGSCALFAAAIIVCGQTPAAASLLAWDISGGSMVSLSGSPRANGAQFSVGGMATVDALGFWDNASAPLLNAHVIQLWTDTGTLLAAATVDNSSYAVASADTSGQWLFTNISPLTLDPGTYRVAAGYAVAGDDPVRFGTAVVTSIGATWLGEAFSSGGTGTTAFPVNLAANPLFGANVLFNNSTPEPASLALCSLALSSLALCSLALSSLALPFGTRRWTHRRASARPRAGGMPEGR